uniref:TEP1-F n=1 Tax=Epanerchodus sp. RS-2014 TaxID=1569310 RepID=A0A0E4B7X1_9MYRI|nr:thioester-containing protein 2 [Epanerchodus sp. RS-2014]
MAHTFCRLLFALVAVLLSVTQLSSAVGTYTLVGPKVLRPGLSYQVSVSIHDTREPVKVTVSITGQGLAGVNYGQTTEALIQSGETQILKFEIGEWGPGRYNISISGSGGLRFSNTTEIEYQHKSYSVFIQTDKAVYQPNQMVHFRAIVVNPMLRPTVSGAIEVYITDGQGNRVKQWRRVFTTKGVFSGSLQLSDQPVLGNWNITVFVSDQQYTKSFTVMEYVLPTYEVTVQLPPYATFNDTSVVATVTARYTYGKPVKGELTLVMSPKVHSPVIQAWVIPPVRKLATIDGVADVSLDLSHFRFEDDFQRDIRVEAIVRETLTGQRQNSSAILSLYSHRVKLDLIKTAETFKPGLKFTAYLKVALQDDIPIRDDVNKVRVKFGYNYNESSHEVREYQIPRNGIIQLDFYPPRSPEANVLIILAEYLDIKQPFPGIESSLSLSNNYIQALLLTDNPRVADEVEVQINTTERIMSFVFQVYGRGNLALAQTIPMNNEKYVRFKFRVSSRMAPKARFLAYYVRGDGEVVADSLNFYVEGVFQTPVAVGVSANRTGPGTLVEVKVNTKPNAFVGILGVDQKVLLLKSGNDITRDDVLKELVSYDGGADKKLDDFYARYYWSPGTITASQVFEDAGVVIVTNGNVFQYYPRLLYRSNIGPDSDLEYAPDNSLGNSIFVDSDSPDSIRLRQHFPETWLWNNTVAQQDGVATISATAPDTITSWIVSAFAIDSITGLGVVRAPAKLTIFRPFFVSVVLPYSVIRDEAVAIQVVVFNYMAEDVKATVTLKNQKGQFEFANFETGANEVVDNSQPKYKRVQVKAGDGTSISFMIIPKLIGSIDIDVTAQSDRAGDRVLKKLLVKPEGTQLNFNKAVLVDLRSTNSFTSTVKVGIPNYAVEGSARVEISVIGDMLGPAINNLDSLLRMPFGCGEQNMVYFVPNIVVARYLEFVNRLQDTIKQKILSHLETGYQRELTYKREDGSFSAFGKQDKMGSTWLTAFVAKSFHDARNYVTIDENVVNGALKWLAMKQEGDGSFPEVGSVSHKAMQGGSANGLALTAYVLIAFLETGAQQTQEFSSVVDKTRQNIEQVMLTVEDSYALAIATYALHLAGSQERETAFRKLDQRSITNDEQKFWTGVVDNNDVLDPPENDEPKKSKAAVREANSYDVEMTSYALMTYILRNDIDNALKIAKWLISQTNSNGGFTSTQDTVIGIQALAKLAQQVNSPRRSVDVTFSFNNSTKTVPINNENAMILHKYSILDPVDEVRFTARGSGFAIAQVSYSYNVNITQEKPSFIINPLVDRNSNRNLLVINACTSYTRNGSSNMAVVEVDLPSGYTVDKDSLPALLKMKDIKRVDTKAGDSGVVIYFDKLSKGEEVCPTVKAFRTFKVAKQKPTAVKAYDYYDQSRSARSFYQALPATLCDICDDDECERGSCPKNAGMFEDYTGNSAASFTLTLINVFTFIIPVWLISNFS